MSSLTTAPTCNAMCNVNQSRRQRDTHLLCTRAVDSTGLSLCPGRSFLFWYTYAYELCRFERLGGGGGPPSSAANLVFHRCAGQYEP